MRPQLLGAIVIAGALLVAAGGYLVWAGDDANRSYVSLAVGLAVLAVALGIA